MPDRSDWPVRKYKLGEEPMIDPYLKTLTPEQRLKMVWTLTQSAWAMTGKPISESRLPRHAWPVRKFRMRRAQD